MFLAAQERGCVRPVAMMAALTQGRNFLLRGVDRRVEEAREELLGEEHESDFFLLMRAWRYADQCGYSLDACRRLGIHAQAARQVGPLFEQFVEIADGGGPRRLGEAGRRRRRCASASSPGFPDHLARRLDAATLRCELVHGRRGLLARESAIGKAPLLVAAEITEVGGRGGRGQRAPQHRDGGRGGVAHRALSRRAQVPCARSPTMPQAKRVVARRENGASGTWSSSPRRTRDDVPLERGRGAPRAGGRSPGRISIDAWDESVEQWITRVNRLAEWFPELEVNPITPADRVTLVEQVCYGETSARGVKGREVMPVLRDWLTAEQLAAMDELVPERLTMANGRRSRLTYPKEGPPVLSARIQELYGIEGRFSLGRGRVPVKIEVLAPNQRPIQVTDDLTNFWQDIYPKIRPELSRRYPRHEWR